MLYNLDVYTDLLSYLGIEPGNGTPDVNIRIVQAYNAALQTLYAKGPYWMRKNKGAAICPAPQGITIGVTNGSVSLTDGSQITQRMIGCMIRIEGEPGDNEIVDNQTLLVPITQPTAEVSATVYFNAVVLPHTVNSVSGNVFLDDTAWELQPLFYGENQLYKQWPAFPVDAYYTLQTNLYLWVKIGIPTGYYVQPLQKQVAPSWGSRLMIWPVPNSQRTLKWDQELSAPCVTLAELELDLINPDGSYSEQPTQAVAIPGGMHEKVLLPLARYELSSYPHFLESKRAFITSQWQEALSTLKEINPRRQSGAQVRPEYFMPN
jgi:hypothetical protein